MTARDTLHIPCNESDKSDWIRSAQVADMALADWVIENLNAAKTDTRPTWANGLSDRATIGLLSAGFTSRESVQNAVADGYKFYLLSNVGRGVEAEIVKWAMDGEAEK